MPNPCRRIGAVCYVPTHTKGDLHREQAEPTSGTRSDQGTAQEKKHQHQALREQQQAQGLTPRTAPESSNGRSPYASIEEEGEARRQAITEHARILRAQWPVLARRLRRISDLRQPKKTKHTLTVLMLYGILVFMLHYTSRRQANAQITHPMIEHNLRQLFPELECMPHADTLFRLLRQIEVAGIEQAHLDLVNHLIRKKKFAPYRVNNSYPIAIDGSQKMAGSQLWSEELLQRRVSGAPQEAAEPPAYQYYVYVLEASLSFRNGMVIPLMSEFLDYQQGDTPQDKQDCETRAFHRLAERIKRAFPRLPILLLLDGLYAQGPVMARCRDYHWQFMIVLKDRSLPTVWAEYQSLLGLDADPPHRQNWGERRQQFRWVNHIRYEYGPNARHHLNVHVVICEEQWQAVDEHAEIVTKRAKHAWISSRPLHAANVHERCNLAARYRWGIETGFLVEKHQGYAYEHAFAKDWNAMRGYHYLMRLAHLLNTLVRFSSTLAPLVRQCGVRPFIEFLRTTLSGPWLDHSGLDEIARRMRSPFQLRLI